MEVGKEGLEMGQGKFKQKVLDFVPGLLQY
jgi:hypothetical protein